MPVPQ